MKEFLSIVLILAIMFTASLAFAQGPVQKLSRGLLNTLTGFFELPLNIIRKSAAEGYAQGLSVGLVEGIIKSVHRTLVGVYEVVTFLIPAPAGYEAILMPENLLTSETLHKADPAMRSDFRPLSGQLEKSRK